MTTTASRAALFRPAVTSLLSAAASLLDMELVYLAMVDPQTLTLARVVGGPWPGLAEGETIPRADSFCGRMLDGAPASTADASADPNYRDTPTRRTLGICAYVGVPVVGRDGRPFATLAGVDHGARPVPGAAVAVLNELAAVLAAELAEGEPGQAAAAEAPAADVPGGPVIVRTASGWRVQGEPADDLLSALTLADLLTTDLAPGLRPPRPAADLDEPARLRLAVTQLEHALAARVTVEQAIGVLAERHHAPPRAAFERLRKAARSRGRRVHDLAREVVASTTNPSVPLPPELHGRR